jgi:hypothetical protein
MDNQPLDISLNLGDTKTAIPTIKDGELVPLRLVSLGQVATEKGKSTKWEYDLVSPAPDSDGGVINPGAMGSKVFENIQLYAKPDAKDPKWYEKRIATRIDALLGTGDKDNKKGKPPRPDLNSQLVPQLIGKTLVAKMRVRTGEYTGNEIASVTYPGDIAA